MATSPPTAAQRHPWPGSTCRMVPAHPITFSDSQAQIKTSVSWGKPPQPLENQGGHSGPGRTYLDGLLPDGRVGVQEAMHDVGKDLGVDCWLVEVLDELLHLAKWEVGKLSQSLHPPAQPWDLAGTDQPTESPEPPCGIWPQANE